jgi:deoxyadenosine/deoxycytidine kinase
MFIPKMSSNNEEYEISLEAGIGVGKSTILDIFSKKFGDKFNVIFEPLQEWLEKYRDENTNILNMFYSNIERWGYTFQMNAFMTRIQKIKNERDTNKINLTERSILSDHLIFAKMLYDDGKITTVEWKLYEDWFKWLSYEFNSVPKKIIYLRCDPNVAFQRIHKRNRCEESGITFEYIEKLHKYHDEWLLNETRIPVLVIDVSCDFEGDDKKINEIYSKIMEFI